MSKNPSIIPMHAAPKCCAKSKRSGLRCKAPAVKGKNVCRMHGARGGAPQGDRNGNWRHGARSREFLDQLETARMLRRLMLDLP